MLRAGPPTRCKRTYSNFHVARPNSALQKENEFLAKGTSQKSYFAVAFSSFGIITLPDTPAIGGGGRGGRTSFSTPPSPNKSPVHGSMYALEGG
jgi:hypothetical protein